MKLEDKIQEWARKNGYIGPMPKKMSSFCNESTLHVWNDIMTKVKPRYEVEEIHRKVLVHRLKAGVPLPEAIRKESDIYHKLKSLTKFKEEALAHITEKELQLKKSQKLVKQNAFELERIKASNNELEMKTFLFEEKINSYTSIFSKVQSKVNFVKNTVFLSSSPNLAEERNISAAVRDYSRNNSNFETNSTEAEKITDLLHSHRCAVFNETHVSEEILLQYLSKMIGKYEHIANISTNEVKDKYDDERFELYRICLEHEIEAKIRDIAIERLEMSLQFAKDSYGSKLQSQLCSSTDIDNALKCVASQAKLIGLDSANTTLKKAVDDLNEEINVNDPNSNNVAKVKPELQKINDSMSTAINNISIGTGKLSEIRATIERRKIKSKLTLEMLLAINLDYLSLMNEDILSRELYVYRDYPLEYYKQNRIDGNIYYSRNNHLFSQAQSSMLSELNVTPLKTSWEVLMTIYEDLKWLTQLIQAAKCSSTLITADITPISVAKDFKHNSEIVQKLVYDLKTAKQRMNIPALHMQKQITQEILNTWTNLKFGMFISVDKLFENKNYAYYENEFMTCYNML